MPCHPYLVHPSRWFMVVALDPDQGLGLPGPGAIYRVISLGEYSVVPAGPW